MSALESLRQISNLQRVWEEFLHRTGGRSAPGIDGITPAVFRDQSRWRLRKIGDELRDGYCFSALRGLAMPKKDVSKLRLICVPTVADRIVQRALLTVIEGQSAKLGILNTVSYGFVRDVGGLKRGVQGAHKLAVKLRREAPWAFKADISRFFDTIQREELARNFCRAFRQKSLSGLVRGVIGCEVDADGPRVAAAISQNKIVCGVGLRQGMPLSPILSNFLLRNFDSVLAKAHNMVRYADDLVVFTKTEAECLEAAQLVEEELGKLHLTLSTTKSGICRPDEAVEFLGMELRRKGSSGYELAVSEAQFGQIRSRFAAYHDFDLIHAQDLDASALFRRLDQMRLGYLSAYEAADNYADVDRRTAQWTQECARKVYGTIFGATAISKLSAKQLKFLMLA